MKLVFLDTEFTSLHHKTTLVSVGMVTLDGQEFYISLNDYDRDQITPWVQEHVISKIDESKSVSTRQALSRLEPYLERYAAGDRISLVTPGKSLDISLVFQMWHALFPERKYFYVLECLPYYLNHREHFDLETFFLAAGLDPSLERETYVHADATDHKHHALYDAKVIRLCFLKMLRDGLLPKVAEKLARDAHFRANSAKYFKELNSP